MVEKTLQNDYSELVSYLDEKFAVVDTRFDKLFDVFATKEDLQTAIENLPTKADFVRS